MNAAATSVAAMHFSTYGLVEADLRAASAVYGNITSRRGNVR